MVVLGQNSVKTSTTACNNRINKLMCPQYTITVVISNPTVIALQCGCEGFGNRKNVAASDDAFCGLNPWLVV